MHIQRPLSFFAVTVTILTLPLSNALLSQTPPDQEYDKAKQVTVTGMLIGSAAPNLHSVYLLTSPRTLTNVRSVLLQSPGVRGFREAARLAPRPGRDPQLRWRHGRGGELPSKKLTTPRNPVSAQDAGRDWRRAGRFFDRSRSLLRSICGSDTR